MYAGRTNTPCCLCGSEHTVSRFEIAPRAVTLMKNSGPIAWRDIVGAVTLSFCESDWELVSELALEMDMHPLSRCNVAYASFSLREDFEALLSAKKDEPDQTKQETKLLDRSRDVIDSSDDPYTEDRDRVEAIVIGLSLEELGVIEAAPHRKQRPPSSAD